MPVKPLHPTFPLTALVIQAVSPGAALDYFQPETAQRLLHDLRQQSRKELTDQELAGMHAGELAAVGLIGKLSLHLISRYLEEQQPELLEELARELSGIFQENGRTGLLLTQLIEAYPPPGYLSDMNGPEHYLNRVTGEITNRHLLLISLLVLLLGQENRAFRRYGLFLDDPQFEASEAFRSAQKQVDRFFQEQPEFRDGLDLWSFLKRPFQVNPDSIYDQLEYILREWGDLLDESWILSLRRRLDLIREDHRQAGLTPGPAQAPDFSSPELWENQDQRRFSLDLDWMPRVVLLAKNVFVWLDQLSKAYGKPVERLDQIPLEELEKLASWGINALWLIGIWQRSPASRKIKRMTGNPEAEASAYALYDYVISGELGGEEAYQGLVDRAHQAGIRLAADMVPNHVGIDSRWVREHPDWFLSLPEPPFPGYSFNGPDLADHPGMQIFLEDHYYDQSDASVVFKRVEADTGQTRYIYHGNDGTSMPWNDTAQLNFLNQRTRQAVQDTILEVAKKFSIIRFDAAMTLAKKHYQRLWFPEPGTGGAIPSRSRYGLSKAEFNRLFPEEFWREVVDRVADEAPDTLLLAEAFWMMEGYFVRTLGMHRVYNSAFMNMLKNEENAKYRSLIKDTLAFDPQILKRYVNFLNNPDEDTAVAQFGSGGKYFGVCLLMATMPGLPMFGHGQIEGYSEKYGMEYRRSYYAETPDQDLIARHQREIFPLLRNRSLFAEVENFVLYDFQGQDGAVNEDVFAYSNRDEHQKALVVFHNRWGETRGKIQTAAEPHPPGLNLFQALDLKAQPGTYVSYRDWISELEYLIPSQELQQHGIQLSLGAYQYHVFTDFQVLDDSEGLYAHLAGKLAGEGTPDLDREIVYLRLENGFQALLKLLEPDLLSAWAAGWDIFEPAGLDGDDASQEDRREGLLTALRDFYSAVAQFSSGGGPSPAAAGPTPVDHVWRGLHRLGSLSRINREVQEQLGKSGLLGVYLGIILEPLDEAWEDDRVSLLLDRLGDHPPLLMEAVDPDRVIEVTRALLDCRSALDDQALLRNQHLVQWFDSEVCRSFLYVHDYQDQKWFQKEALQTMASSWMLYAAAGWRDTGGKEAEVSRELESEIEKGLQIVIQQAEQAGYQVKPFLESLVLDDPAPEPD
jgi:glycosidase